MTIRFFILLTFFVLRLGNLYGQSEAIKYGKVKVKMGKVNTKYWDRIIFQNKDTTIEGGISSYYSRSKMDSIPQGRYTVTLNSMFNDNIVDTVNVGAKTTIRYDIKDYYHFYGDTISFLDLLTDKDTIRIHYEQWGCWGGPSGYCIIVKNNAEYSLVFKNDSNEIRSFTLSKQEESRIRQLELQLRNRKESKCLGTVVTRYEWELNKYILDNRACGFSYINELIITHLRKK